MRHLVLILALSLALPAWANVAPAAPWPDRYQAALDLAKTGGFGSAADALEALAADPSGNPVHHARATAVAELLRAWAKQGYRLKAPASRVGTRTTGELARLYIDTIWYGLGSGGMIASHTEPESAAGVLLPMLGLAGLSAGAVAWIDSNNGWPYGNPRAVSAGLRIGLLEGLAFTGWYQAQAKRADQLGGAGVSTMIWGFTTAGAVAGGVLGSYGDWTPGQAATVESGALWTGALSGLLVAAIVPDDKKADDAFMLSAVIGLNAGVAGAAWLAEREAPSADRALFLDLGGIAGTITAGGLYIAFADDDIERRPLLLVTAAGMAAGLGTAWVLTAHLPPDPPAQTAGTKMSLQMLPIDGGGMLGAAGTF
jgi:hypothetical protein